MEYWSVHGPPDSTVSVSRDQAAAILALIDGLNEVRNSVGRLVRENWSLAQITDIGKPDVSLGVHMGDTYSNISGSTIVNRSLVQNSFNRVQEQLGDEVAQALRQLADVIERSGNTEAAENFNAFNEELQKDQPKKPVLRSLWQGILSTLPAIGQMTDIVAKISAIL